MVISLVLAASFLAAASVAGRAGPRGHYMPGSYGLGAAVVPQARLSTFKSITGLYYSTEYYRDDGTPVDVDGSVDVIFGDLKYRFMTGRRVFGANASPPVRARPR